MTPQFASPHLIPGTRDHGRADHFLLARVRVERAERDRIDPDWRDKLLADRAIARDQRALERRVEGSGYCG